jgi:hypothetical protein
MQYLPKKTFKVKNPNVPKISKKAESCWRFEVWLAIDCNTPLAYGTNRSFFLDKRIVSINAAVFAMSINHRKSMLEWLKGQLRTSAMKEK